MPRNWWTRKNLVLAAAAAALAFIGFVVIGVSYPEPAASAALGPDGSAAGWPSSSRPAAGPDTASLHPSDSPKSRCADGCGRYRIGPVTELATGASYAKTARLVVAASAAALLSLPAGVALAQGRRAAEPRQHPACGNSTAAPEPKAPENKDS
jgi:hypothetical protein